MTNARMIIKPRLLDLPREVIRTIVLHVYDPLQLSQQDRLTWGIFSTVDMHEERQDDLASLIALSTTCRKIRKEARVILFRCVRTPTIRHAEEVIRNRDGWARYVKSIIIDLSMFDHDDDSSSTGNSDAVYIPTVRRSFWSESTLLHRLITSLPSLNHMSFFADASDDATLALLMASLIPHPSTHPIPPPSAPLSPSATSNAEGHVPPSPLITRLKSFGWRQRAQPPQGLRTFAQNSTFVSTLHVLRHAHRLSFLVLDADLDEMYKEDILTACRELALREAPLGETPEKVSLMLCGPIKGWEDGLLGEIVDELKDIKELFFDRPLKKSSISYETTAEDFITHVRPLSQLPYLQLLQVGSYTFSLSAQTEIAARLAAELPALLVLGLLGEMGDTSWWGIWRRTSKRQVPEGEYQPDTDVTIVPLGDGHLARLEEEGARWARSTAPTPAMSEKRGGTPVRRRRSSKRDWQGEVKELKGDTTRRKSLMSLEAGAIKGLTSV